MGFEIFSTASFLRGTQCEKSLFLHANYPELRDSTVKNSAPGINRRYTIAQLTKHLFPKGVFAGVDVTGSCDESFELTKNLLAGKHKTIYNACFKYEDIFCIVDVLNREHGYWKAYGIWDVLDPDDHITLTGALQYFVITRCRIRIDDYLTIKYKTSLDDNNNMHLDYNVVSARERIIFLQEHVEDRLLKLKNVIKRKTIPEIPIGDHCKTPKVCDYFEYCRFSGRGMR
ncbi:MAG: hypothetical protein PHN88_03730 [Ignavibacteria bacterium]|nr:hypothetical protein [Ignavibacteria bacterium]